MFIVNSEYLDREVAILIYIGYFEDFQGYDFTVIEYVSELN